MRQTMQSLVYNDVNNKVLGCKIKEKEPPTLQTGRQMFFCVLQRSEREIIQRGVFPAPERRSSVGYKIRLMTKRVTRPVKYSMNHHQILWKQMVLLCLVIHFCCHIDTVSLIKTHYFIHSFTFKPTFFVDFSLSLSLSLCLCLCLSVSVSLLVILALSVDFIICFSFCSKEI